MSVGERGPAGDHGQSGEPGRHGTAGVAGAKGEKGEKGASGVTPLVVRQANLAYIVFFVGVVLFVFFSQYQERRNDERDAAVIARFEAEATATDRAFCSFFNYITSDGLNPNRDAIRSLQSSVRKSFEMVRAREGSTAEEQRRVDAFRADILAQIDQVEINGNFPILDCSGIGNGKVDFSLQDAIREAMATTTTVPG